MSSKDDNVIDFESRKLLRDAEVAIDGISNIVHEAMVYAVHPEVADNPEFQEFLKTMESTMGELADQMKALNEDLEKLKVEEENE